MTILSPNGRLNRLQYFIQSFLTGVIVHALVAAYFIAALLGSRTVSTVAGNTHTTTYSFTSPVAAAMIAALLVIGLVCWWVLTASQIKRLHDLNQSGWLVLINLIPGAAFVMWVVLVCAKGYDQPNAYGRATA